MPKVTYLFGAGASARCLPIVNQIPGMLRTFGERLKTTVEQSQLAHENVQFGNQTYGAILNEMRNVCIDLSEQSANHASIDTYAKKLIITGKNTRYLLLKTILSIFFIDRQFEQPLDNRYDTFFASVLSSARELNDAISILSWNYDFQFEKAFSSYSHNKEIRSIQNELKVFPSHLSFEGIISNQRFSICKINGTTAFKNNGEYDFTFSEFTDSSTLERYKKYADQYILSMEDKNYKPGLAFAWERLRHGQTYMPDFARAKILGSEAIVIIGYSFPFFNRAIDKKIFETVSDCKIYIQDTQPDKVERSMRSVLPPRLKSYNIEHLPIDSDNPDQFFLPPELDTELY